MSHRTAPGLVATYRVQLRNGVDLDMVRGLIPWLRELGVSHLYLSPLFSAARGSTHGYDVTDPKRVDPILGGEAAFRELSAAARAAHLGLILDIVPNHMAFTPDNPYVADLMRKGRGSDFAQLFDIDWDKGPLHFPVLDGEPAEMLAAGTIAFARTPEGPALRVHGEDYPLRPTALGDRLGEGEALTEEKLSALLAAQHWQLGHWRASAERIVHRRFFNIASLIGVRQEDPEVFDFTHRWIVEQVRAGRVQGLRVDHIDGLARPGAYLSRLRHAVGFVPIWVEKIVKPGEALPAAWPVEGMSGYEFMTPVTQFLTDAEGLAALRDAARSCVPEDYAGEVRNVRREMLRTVFVPEVDRVTGSAMEALAGGRVAAPGVPAAIVQLAAHWPVYRSYAGDAVPLGPAFAPVFDAARGDHLPSEMLAQVFNLLSAADDPPARAFASAFEQLTGALTAKSEEDTAFFRAIAYLPFCEVGAQPDLEAIDGERWSRLMSARAQASPCALNALSTHDTKRSADARAALIALTYLPALGRRLYETARERARAAGVAERWGLYAVQTALMTYSEADAEERLVGHVEKAMREAKDISCHETPDPEAEAAVAALLRDFVRALQADILWSGQERAAFESAWHDLVLAQLALQLTAPGIPDVYQGTEIVRVSLTDPDNRRPVAWDALGAPARELDRRKLALTRALLALRRQHAELFAMGGYALQSTPRSWTVHRQWKEQQIAVDIARPARQLSSVAAADPMISSGAV